LTETEIAQRGESYPMAESRGFRVSRMTWVPKCRRESLSGRENTTFFVASRPAIRWTPGAKTLLIAAPSPRLAGMGGRASFPVPESPGAGLDHIRLGGLPGKHEFRQTLHFRLDRDPTSFEFHERLDFIGTPRRRCMPDPQRPAMEVNGLLRLPPVVLRCSPPPPLMAPNQMKTPCPASGI